jgi:hypothetical protein
MSKGRIFILTQLKEVSIVTAIICFTLLGYTCYHYQMVGDQFYNWTSQAAKKTFDINDSQMDFGEIIADIQETLVYDDSNLQVANDEWEGIYNYVDQIQGK